MTPYFSQAGIDINAIRKRSQFEEARVKAAPFFIKHLRAIADEDVSSLAGQALKSLVKGDYDTFNTLMDKLGRRHSLDITNNES